MAGRGVEKGVDFPITASDAFSDAFDKLKSKVVEATSNFERMKGLMTTAFAGISLAGFGALIKGSIDAADHLNDLSKATGIAVEELAGLKVAAKQSGGDLESIAASVNKLAVNMGKDGERFKALGITAKDPLEAFKQLADVFVAIKDPQLRAAVAADALGKAWAGAAPLLAEGSKKIEEMVAKGTKYSGVTAEMARQADEFNDKWVLLVGTGGLMNALIGPLLPLLNLLADELLKARDGASQLDGGFKPLLETGKVIAVVVSEISFVLKAMGREIAAWAVQLGLLTDAFIAVNLLQFDKAGQSLREFGLVGKQVTQDAKDARAAQDAWVKKLMEVGTATDQVKEKVIQETAAQRASRLEAEAKAKAFVANRNAAREASDSLIATLQKELSKISNLSGEDKKLNEVMIEIAKLKKEGKQVDEAEILRIAVLIDAKKEQLRIDKFLNEEHQKDIDFRKSEGDALEALSNNWADMTRSLQEEVDLLGKSNVERQKIILLRKRDEDITAANRDAAVIRDINSEYDKQLALLGQIDRFNMWGKWADAAGNFFSDLVMNGKSAFDNLKQQIKSLLAELIALFAKRWILNLAAGGAGSGTTAGGALNYLSGAWSAYRAGAGASSFFGASGAVGAGGTGAFAGGTAAGSTSSSLAGAAVTVAWVAAIVAAMYANNELFTRGWRRDNQDSSGYVNPLTSVSYTQDRALQALGFSPRAASLLTGSSVNARLFGLGPTHEDAAGMRGSVGFGTFQGTGWQDYSQRGGVFRSDRRWQEDFALTADQKGPFEDIMTGFKQSLARIGKMIGVDSGALLANFTREFNIQLTSSSSQQEVRDAVEAFFRGVFVDQAVTVFGAATEDISRYITNFKGTTAELVAFAEQLAAVAQTMPTLHIEGLNFAALDEVALKGETVIQTFTRVADTFMATSLILDTSFGAVGMATFAARAELVQLTGGLEAFANLTQSYYANFYTETERTTLGMASLTSQFKYLGLEMPTTRAAFRTLLESFDLTTESGRALYAAVLKLNPAFASLVPAIEDVGHTVATVVQQVQQATVDWTAYQLQHMTEADRLWYAEYGPGGQERRAAKTGLGGYLDNLLLGDKSPLDPMQQLGAARAQYEKTLALAQGGDLGGLQGLQGASNAYLDLARKAFGSTSDYVDIFNKVFNQVAGVAGTKDINTRLAEINQANLIELQSHAAKLDNIAALLISIRDQGPAAANHVAGAVEDGSNRVAKAVQDGGNQLARR